MDGPSGKSLNLEFMTINSKNIEKEEEKEKREDLMEVLEVQRDKN